jgi:hypothetical protein
LLASDQSLLDYAVQVVLELQYHGWQGLPLALYVTREWSPEVALDLQMQLHSSECLVHGYYHSAPAAE